MGVPVLELFGEGAPVAWPCNAPDGVHYAYAWRGALWIAEYGSHPQCLTSMPLSTGTEYGGRVLTFSADSQVVFFSSEGQLYAISSQGGIPVPLPKPAGFDAKVVCYGPSAAKNNKLLYFHAEDNTRCAVAVLPLPPGYADNLAALETLEAEVLPFNSTFNYDPVGAWDETVAVQSWSAPNMAWNSSTIELWSPSNSAKTITRRLTDDGVHSCQPRFSPDGRWLSFLSDQGGYLNLYIAPASAASKSNSVQLVNEPFEAAWDSWRVGSSSYSWISNSAIVYARSVEARTVLVRIDINFEGTAPRIAHSHVLDHLEKGYYHDIQAVIPANKQEADTIVCTFSNYCTREVLCGIAGLHEPATAHKQTLVESGLAVPASIRARLSAPVHITYPVGTTGAVSHALLYMPKAVRNSSTRPPCIVWAHGGPTGASQDAFALHVQYFVSEGWAMCLPNYRGSRGYGRAYREALNHNWGVSDVEDCAAAFTYCVNEALVDAARGVVMGGSAGGYLTLQSVLTESLPWRAGVALCPVADLYGLNTDSHLLERHYTSTLIGPLPEAKALYEERSPVERVLSGQAISCKPVLLCVGVDDTVVPAQQSRDFKAVVNEKCSSAIVELAEYPGQHHFFSDPRNLSLILANIVRFVSLHAA